MKDWFPLASYEFYAFLTTGMVAVAAFDRVFLGSALALEQHWTIPAGVFWAAVSYLTGQILAMPSSALLEHVMARKVLHSPTEILLGIHAPRLRERCLAAIAGAREYQPFPAANQTRMMRKLSASLNVSPGNVEAEAAFTCAFPHARSVPDTATRLDNFINQYGLCRNVSFAAGLAAVMLGFDAWKSGDHITTMLAVGASVLSFGLFLRFIKFYAAYAREVFRTYDNLVA